MVHDLFIKSFRNKTYLEKKNKAPQNVIKYKIIYTII